MWLRFVVAACLFAAAASAQPIEGSPDDAYQVRYAANLNVADSTVTLQNAGTSGGTICVNAYVLTADGSMQACCACQLPPDALASWSVRNDLISNLLTPVRPGPASVTIKLLASSQATCNAATVTAANLAPGMVAWGSTIKPVLPSSYTTVETEFSRKGLSAAELSKLTTNCGTIQSNGSGFGICNFCRLGAQ